MHANQPRFAARHYSSARDWIGRGAALSLLISAAGSEAFAQAGAPPSAPTA